MRSPIFAAFVLSASLAMTASAQVKSVAAANNQPSSKPASDQGSPSATRARILRPDLNSGSTAAKPVSVVTPQNQAKSDFNNHSEANRFRRTTTNPAPSADSSNKADNLSRMGHSSLKPASAANKTSLAIAKSATAAPAPLAPVPAAMTATQIYRVGAGDVLDIQLAENPGRNSTLFTVLDDGVLEYPLAANPIVVGGMTTAEISTLLRQRIKIFENPNVKVDVRDFASHTVSISGLVAAPGTKILRREAMPLYAILAQALVLPEAGSVTITREGQAPIVVDLKNGNTSATLVVPGDSIKVAAAPPAPTEFFFVGGEINSPGQKSFHAGLTLTQAILASGGTKTSAGAKVKVSRQAADGRLATEEFNLRKIQSGKTPDPVLQKGDRVEVTTGN
ncbi:MAG TPA: polysaccharide biosynthesis/export family protein [Pyrinomonadaceae bacterium]|jgi:protein involved in polysaccharide export with SLBB domain|nr:polysaccharide biosynthesis/export family protein [Pyrinomonadaceae bacterium]